MERIIESTSLRSMLVFLKISRQGLQANSKMDDSFLVNGEVSEATMATSSGISVECSEDFSY